MTLWSDIQPHLAPYKLKKQGKEWRCNSPFRTGADSHSFCIFVNAGDETGCYYDQRSGEKGSLYDLADHFGVQWERKQIGSTKHAYKDMEEYALAHGVTADILKKAGWYDAGMVYDDQNKKERPALGFKTANGDRHRFLDGLKPPYKPKASQGYKACWYGLDRAIGIAERLQSPLILLASEISTVVGQHYDVPVAGKTNGESGKLPDDMLEELTAKWKGDLWIVHDCDDAGRKMADVWSEQIGERAHRIDMGLSDGGDLADFVMLHTTNALSELRLRLIFNVKAEDEKDFVTVTEALQVLSDEFGGSIIPNIQPQLVAFNFLHQYGGCAHIITPGQMVYLFSVSGGTKTTGVITGIQNQRRWGLNALLRSDEWIDKESKGSQIAMWLIQQAGGPSYMEQIRHRMALVEQARGGELLGGRLMSETQISMVQSMAQRQQRFDGELFMLTKPGMSTEAMCAAIDRTCQSAREMGRPIHSIWVDFAQQLWMESLGRGGQIWIESAMGMLKEVLRLWNATGYVTSQMNKAPAELAKADWKLSSDMMQWLSEQQANLVVGFLPKYDTYGSQILHKKTGLPLIHAQICKNSKEGRRASFDFTADFTRGVWLDNPRSTWKDD